MTAIELTLAKRLGLIVATTAVLFGDALPALTFFSHPSKMLEGLAKE